MNWPFVLLIRHFFGRFFDNEIVSQTADMRTNVIQALGLLAAPGMFLPFYMIPWHLRFDLPFDHNWLLIDNYYCFIVYSMAVMGLVMVFEWDAIFPDRKDYIILTPLPLGGNAIFLGKVVALIAFLGLFVADCNLFCTLLAPPVTDPSAHGLPILYRLVIAHAAAVVSAGVFTALALAALQGLLINLLTARAFRRISSGVQMGCMAVMVTLLFLTPTFLSILRPVFQNHSPLLRFFPPYWFLAIYLDLLPGRPAGTTFHEAAMTGWHALEIAAAAFTIAYLAGYRRHARRVMESLETAGQGPGPLRLRLDAFVNRYLLPHPLERATFHFITNTVLRTARHRLFLASYTGIAFALAIPGIIRISAAPGQPFAAFSASGLLALPLTVTFFAVSGLRAAFNLPAELRANWLFQICESDERMAHIRGARKWIVVMGIAPVMLLLAPLEITFSGLLPALVHLSFALILSLLLLNLLMVWFRKIPFTCSYFPGKTSMAGMAFLYILGFLFYCLGMAAIEARLMRAPLKLALFYIIGIAALRGLSVLEQRELGVDDSLIYEDEPDPVVRTLELG